MRTPLTLEAETISTAQSEQLAPSLETGQSVSDPIQKCIGDDLQLRKQSGVWVFDLPHGTPTVSAARVKDLLDELQ